MAIKALIWIGLRTAWSTMLYFWMQAAWSVPVVVGLLMLTGQVDGYSCGVIVLIVVVLNWVAFWCSHHVALMPSTRQITEDRNPYLYGVVFEQAQLACLPMPKVIESKFFTAFASGRSPRYAIVGVSSTLQCTLERRELGAVIAHEMAHVRNRDALVMTVAITVVGLVLAVSLLVGFHWWIGAIVLLLSVMSWLRESHADTTAAYVCGDSAALASALNKLPRSGFLSFLLSPYTHPPTKLRVWCLKRLAKRNA